MSAFPKYPNEICYGININITDREQFESVEFGVYLINIIHKLYPENFQFRESRIDKLWGNGKLRESIIKGKGPQMIFESYYKELNEFKELRKQFLIY